MIRALWVALVTVTLTLALGTGIILSSVLRLRRLPCICRRLSLLWARGILRGSGVRVRVRGEENLPRGVPLIVVSNHQSWFDVFALAVHFPEPVHFVGKKELENIPVFGPAWKACGHVSIDRHDRKEAIRSLEEAGRIIREDASTVVLFAEGTRSPTGALQPFKKGAFVLAIQSGVPVVPVAIVGSREVMPKGEWRIRAGEVEIRIGEILPVEGLQHRDRDALRRRAHAAVARLKGEGPTPIEGTTPVDGFSQTGGATGTGGPPEGGGRDERTSRGRGPRREEGR